MAIVKIQASVEKKDEKLKNVRDIIETLNHVYADEKLMISFKDKFRDWTTKVIKEWRSCNDEKSDEFQNSKLFRVLSTTFISVCFLEFLKCCLTEALNMSYMMLIAVYYLLLVVMDLTSVVLITYLRSPSIFFYQIYEHFEMVLCMYRLLNHRINNVQRRMNLNVNRQNSLPPDLYAFEENSRAKFSYSLFSLYNSYGIYLAFCIFISFSYFHYESLTVLTYLTFNLLFLFAASKVFAILEFLRKNINRRKNVQALTDGFKTWFDNKCELKRILLEYRENTKIFSAFSHRSSKTFPADEYLNFLIFALTCEGIFHSNFNDQDLEKAVFVLLYGQFCVPKDDSQSNQFIQITTSCNRCNEFIKSTKFLGASSITADDEKIPENKVKTNKIVKSSDSKDRRENIPTCDANEVNESFQNEKGKSRIPRYVRYKKRTPLSSKVKKPPVHASMKDTLQLTFCDEYVDNLSDLSNKQNADLVHHSNSSCDEENDEVDLIGLPRTPSTSASNTNTNATLQALLEDENLRDQNDLPDKQKAYPAIHLNSTSEEKNTEVDLISTPVIPIISESNTVLKTTLQPLFHDDKGDQSDLSAEQKAFPAIHPNSTSEEKNTEVDLIATPVIPIISESNTVLKTTLQPLFQDDDKGDQNDLSSEQKAFPAIHPNSINEEEKNTEVDLISTPVIPIISESNTVLKTTLQPLFHDDKGDQSDLSAEQKAYPAIHPNLCSEEKIAEVNLNVISGNEETDSTSTLLLVVDTSGNCFKVDSKTDFVNQMDLNTGKEKELSINKENIEPVVTCYNGNKITLTAQNSNTISSRSEPSAKSITDSKDDEKSGVKASNGIFDESSGDKVECVTSPLLSNEKNVIDSYNDDMNFNIHARSNPDTDGAKCIDKRNGNNELSLKESAEIGTILRNEIPNENSEITSNNEFKLVTFQNERIQSSSSLDVSENQTDDFKRPETRKGENVNLINFCRTREELSTSQGIYSSNENETMRDLLERISNKKFYMNMNGGLTSNLLSDSEKITVDNFISACQKYLCNEVAEYTNDPKSSPKNDDYNDLSEDFSKLNIQSGDTPNIASNENIPKLNSDENVHGYKTKGVFQIEDILTEPNKTAILDKAFTSTSSQAENMPILKSSSSIDTEQKINQNCSEQNASNNNVEQYGVAFERHETFLTRNVKELSDNSSSSLVVIKGEKHTTDAYNRNNESSENLPHFESTRNPMRNELKPNETICITSCGNSESNKLEDSLSKCTEKPVHTEDALNHNGSKSKLPTENSCLHTNIRAETSDEITAKVGETWPTTSKINEHKPSEDITSNVKIFTGNNSASPQTRIKLRGKRRTKKGGKNRREENNKEAGLNLSELKESENVNRIEVPNISTEWSKLIASEQETSVFTWENFINRNKQNGTTNEYEPSGEISTSQVHNESETKALINRENLNGMERIHSKSVESMKTSAQNDNVNVVLSIRDFDKNDPDKSLASIPVSILNKNKSEELISRATNSVSQNEVDTNASIFKPSQEDSSTNRESKQMSGDLISVMKERTQTSIPPVINERQKNTSKEKICQDKTTENCEKRESNRKEQIKGERDNSCDSYANEQRESYKDISEDISAVGNVNENCDSTASSSDLNRETYTSLNEKKILVADSSQMCNDLEEYNAFDDSSLDVTPRSSKEVFQNTILKQDGISIDGSKKNFYDAISFLTNSDNSRNHKSASGIYTKRKGQTKIRYTDDSVAVNDETGKQNVNSEEGCDKKWNTEVTRKKDKRYICLQKFRGIVVEEDSNTERCEIEQYERQASYVSSCDKLSVTQETTSLKMVEKRNGLSKNARQSSFKEFSEKAGFEQESGTKNKDIKKWIHDISSPDGSSTLSERPPTGSSEDECFHLHQSTSVSNSNTSKNAMKCSNNSADSSVCHSFPEEEQSNYYEEDFSELKNMSNTINIGKGGMKWQSNLGCNSSDKTCREHRHANDGTSATNECLDLKRESLPLNYHLKCDNLDIRFQDTLPNLTLRFVKESENESHSVPKNQKLLETLIHSDSTDEILLPTDSSSLHNGHFSPTHPSEFPEINNIGNAVQMSAERLPTGLIGNLDHQNTRLHPVSDVNKMPKFSSPNQGHNDIRQSEDNKSHEKAAIASTSNDCEIKPDANVCALDSEMKNCEKSNDFIFESEIMKINYNPYSNSESLSISFRRHRNASKLTFKSQEKKLYLKTSKSRFQTDFE